MTTSVFVLQEAERFPAGERRVRFRLSDGGKFSREYAWRLPGPVPTGGSTEEQQ
jgi:hypothetical protein